MFFYGGNIYLFLNCVYSAEIIFLRVLIFVVVRLFYLKLDEIINTEVRYSRIYDWGMMR